ncbi:MAG: MBL fold metallo-hydrolase [Planctomycetales bacterium]|nr:MBL fold metallo-hydrolase [bacterium]UNM10041.1 MAG: MBL fold metallo-hydrolase [Planctomycetales bacterium]
MKLTFLGAAQTVTGSKYLVEYAGQQILVDCGLFQGLKPLRLRNWDDFPIKPSQIDTVLLTHAHIDHSGYIPRLKKLGFNGTVYCTPATQKLCRILLPDSGYLQEEDAKYAKRKGYSKHEDPQPLYTAEDGEKALGLFKSVRFGDWLDIADGISAQWLPAGHILGAAHLMLKLGDKKILFSGDIGRLKDEILVPPTPYHEADYLLCESTYGDRLHEDIDPRIGLAKCLKRTLERGGTVVIPSFAVGRTQQLILFISEIMERRDVPQVPVYVNSPMAVNATDIYDDCSDSHRIDCNYLRKVFDKVSYVNSVEDSKELNLNRQAKVIISASGMATGGRVVHHIKAFAPDPKNMILFAGYQAAGSRGRKILEGMDRIRIFGDDVPINCEVEQLSNMSAHADYREIMDWLGSIEKRPRNTFITHGEENAADSMRERITHELDWLCHVPGYMESADL